MRTPCAVEPTTDLGHAFDQALVRTAGNRRSLRSILKSLMIFGRGSAFCSVFCSPGKLTPARKHGPRKLVDVASLKACYELIAAENRSDGARVGKRVFQVGFPPDSD